MKTLKKIALLVLMGTLFVTCKKEELPVSTVVNQPVFSFTGSINSFNINWQAGQDNYYMYSSYSQDSAGVYSFNGTLQNTASSKNSIQILINDYKAMSKNASLSVAHVDSALSSAKTYGYNTGIEPNGDTLYSVTFTPLVIAGSAQSFTYSFGDGSPNKTSNNSNAVTHIFQTRNYFNTSLKVDFSSCGYESISNPLNILEFTPQLMVSYVQASDTITGDSVRATFTANVANGIAPYTYIWNFGDGSGTTSSVTASTSHTYTFSMSTRNVKLKVEDADHDTASYYYNIYADSGSSVCLFDYTMSSPASTITTTNTDFLSDVTIIYTDGSGVQYTSKNANQTSANFQIISVSGYKSNTNNNPTEMLKVTFNCTLYPVISGPTPISASGCTAVIAVAYPLR